MHDTIREILTTEFGLDCTGLSNEDPLFSSERLDSLNSLRLLFALEDAFGVSISPMDVSIEDIDTIEGIAASITRLKA